MSVDQQKDSRTSAGFTLLATCLGLFLGQVDTTAINLALPAMGRDFDGGIASMQWVVIAYNVTFAALLLTGGTLGDRFGRRRFFRVGIAVFVVGSIVCAVAGSLPAMLVGRVLQGAGSAMMLPQSLAILAVAFPEPKERNRAMAAWSVVAGLGLAAGPTLGGLLVSKLDWSYIFWVNVPLGLASLALTFRYVPESRNERARHVDVLGQVLGVAVLALLTFVVVDGDRTGWGSPLIIGCLVVLVGCAAGFFVVENRQREPMLPLGLMRRGQLPVATVVAMCMTFGMYGMLTLVSLAFQQERGTSALVAGLQLLPLPLVFMALSPVVGKLVTRFGPRLPMAAGMFLMGLGLALFAGVGSDANIWLIEASFVIVGMGLALNTGPVVGVAVSAVRPERAGLASGIANLARMFGAAIGVAVQGTVLAIVSGDALKGPDFTAGISAAMWVGAAVEFTGAIIAFTMVVNPGKQGKKSDSGVPEPRTDSTHRTSTVDETTDNRVSTGDREK
ncbi:MFS transporter [Actinokineospora inagensis]|uniref:MFS transporter n=1 Tax=Actinokineospora inagensis TaxID=103730 RepID=UPI001B7FC39A|nr:MFS transporter [Actinokineospora inagensis]